MLPSVRSSPWQHSPAPRSPLSSCWSHPLKPKNLRARLEHGFFIGKVKEIKTEERKMVIAFGTKERSESFPLEYCSNNMISREQKHPLLPLVFRSFAEARCSRAVIVSHGWIYNRVLIAFSQFQCLKYSYTNFLRSKRLILFISCVFSFLCFIITHLSHSCIFLHSSVLYFYIPNRPLWLKFIATETND